MRRRRLCLELCSILLFTHIALPRLIVAHFSVHDDVLAYPQYRIAWADSAISPLFAQELLHSSHDDKSYHMMRVDASTYLCTLPHIRPASPSEDDTTSLTQAEEEKERLRARNKGWELLRPLEGNCMYFTTGWWTYAFCHNRYVKQFHAISTGNAIQPYPPIQDPSTESFYLGQTPANEKHEDAELYGQPSGQLEEGLTSVDAIGEQRYLVQRMGGGTWCELIKKNRKIEIQFQCDPSGGDRVAWIKETSTCSYLMVIHTPRLCNDLAFMPMKRVGEGDEAHEILCQKVVREAIDGGAKEGGEHQVLELPPGATKSEDDVTSSNVLTMEEPIIVPEETQDNPNSADYLEFIIRPGPLPSAVSLLEETIIQQIADGTFLRPDGQPYSPEDEDTIEYRVELVDDEEDRVFGVLKVRISKGAKVEAEILTENNQEDSLPESLRKELNDWVEGRAAGRPG